MYTIRQFTGSVVYLAALIVVFASSAWADEREGELLAILRSDAPAAEKAITCKLLAIHGSPEAVADLAKLLPNAQLSSWARIAIEAIPGPASDEALRNAAQSLQGRLLIGAINSIGVRRDANAIELLTARLQDSDAQVASAAAVALGRIGGGAATKTLLTALAAAPVGVRSAVAEGCVLCAERLYFEGKSAEAVAIYDEVRLAQVPKQRVIEATRGAILARGQEGIPLLLELFQSPDKKMFQLALGTAREFPGSNVDKALAAELGRVAPQRAALMIGALADRKDTGVLTTILAIAESGPAQVRMAAVDALGRIGDASCLPTLLEIALEDDAQLVQTAKTTLAILPGENVDSQITSLLSQPKGKTYPLLIELVGLRRIDAVPAVLKALDDSDSSVRSAALTALGETITFDDLSVLVGQVVASKHSEDAPAAQQALKAASVRMPDREACAAQLATAVERSSSVPTKLALLEILAEMGGTKALAAMSAAAKDADPQLQDTSTRLLGKWMTADAAPVLLDLAKTAPGKKYQVRALRGYIRIARQFIMPAPKRVEMCNKAFAAAQQTAEQKLVLEVLRRYPSAGTLELAVKAVKIPELKNEATQVVLVIAQKIGGKDVDVKKLLASIRLAKVKLEITKAEYGVGSTQLDVTAVVNKYAGNSPLITLESPSYNTCFGSDPSPGNVKQLRIRYKINGKAGVASFAENAPIVLPMP